MFGYYKFYILIMENYTVWVGGVEVNDFYLTKEKAERLAEEYKIDGYDDVFVENVGENYYE